MWISKWKWTVVAAAALLFGAGGILAATSEPPADPPAPPQPSLTLASVPTTITVAAEQKPMPKEPWELAADYLQAIVDGKPDKAIALAVTKRAGERLVEEMKSAGLQRVRPVMILLNDYQALVVFERAKLRRAANVEPADLHAVVQLQRKDGPEPWLIAANEIADLASIWREADSYLMGKFNFNRVSNKVQPVSIKDARPPTWTIAEEFLRLAIQGKPADALSLVVPGTISEHKIEEMKNLGDFSSTAPVAVLLNERRIEVVFQWLNTPKKETGHVVLMLEKTKDGVWKAKDIDFRDQERLEPRVKMYLEGYYDLKPAAK